MNKKLFERILDLSDIKLNEDMVSLMGTGEYIDEYINSKATNKIRNKISKQLKKVSSYYKTLFEMSDDIVKFLKEVGVILVSGGNEIWEGTFSGGFTKEKTENFSIEYIDTETGIKPTNSIISMSIYKMPSGNYELTIYVT